MLFKQMLRILNDASTHAAKADAASASVDDALAAISIAANANTVQVDY